MFESSRAHQATQNLDRSRSGSAGYISSEVGVFGWEFAVRYGQRDDWNARHRGDSPVEGSYG